MDLTPRLEAIGQSIGECSIVADIGSDHAYLPIYLIKNGKSSKVIASDINKGPADISRNRIKKHGLEQYIEVRLGDGLKVLKPNEADIIVIAGMGGLLIQRMLNDSIDVARSADKIALQPMRDSRSLIKWLSDNSFQILGGEIVKESSKFYEIIWTRYNSNYDNGSTDMVNEAYYYKKTPILYEYIEYKMNEYSKIIKHLERLDTLSNRNRIEECIRELESYREVRQWLSLSVER